MLIHGPNIPGSYAILFFIASDYTFVIRPIHNWLCFPLWLSLFIPSGAISLLFSSGILNTYWPGGGTSFYLFLLFMGFSRQECSSHLLFPSPVDHIFSKLSTMTHPSRVALHAITQSFIQLHKRVIHVSVLVSFFVVFTLSALWWMRIEACARFLLGRTGCGEDWLLLCLGRAMLRRLLIGRKGMTNLDSMLKSKNIT